MSTPDTPKNHTTEAEVIAMTEKALTVELNVVLYSALGVGSKRLVYQPSTRTWHVYSGSLQVARVHDVGLAVAAYNEAAVAMPRPPEPVQSTAQKDD